MIDECIRDCFLEKINSKLLQNYRLRFSPQYLSRDFLVLLNNWTIKTCLWFFAAQFLYAGIEKKYMFGWIVSYWNSFFLENNRLDFLHQSPINSFQIEEHGSTILSCDKMFSLETLLTEIARMCKGLIFWKSKVPLFRTTGCISSIE